MSTYTHRDLSPEDFAVFAAEYAAAFPDTYEPTYSEEEDHIMVTETTTDIETPVTPEEPPNAMAPDAPPAQDTFQIPEKIEYGNGVVAYFDRTGSGIEANLYSHNHAWAQMEFAPKELRLTGEINDKTWAEFLLLVNKEAWFWTYCAGALASKVQTIKDKPYLIGWTPNRMKPDVIGAGADHLVFSNISAHPHGMD